MKKSTDDIESVERSEERIRSNRIFKALSMHTDTTSHEVSYDRPIQNYSLVWLDTNIGEVNDADTIAKLQEVVNTVKKFTNVDECVNFISRIKDEKIFMICSRELCQTIIPLVQDMVQLYSIYIFCKNEIQHEQWAKNWFKVADVHTDITSICEALKQASRNCDQNLVPISFAEPTDGISDQNLDTLDQSFMNTLLLKEALHTIDFEEEHINDFFMYCREQITGNNVSLENVDKIEKEYHDHTPIWWFTYRCLLYSMLNKALRLMEIDRIIKMGFFIRDLHNDIKTLHVEQYSEKSRSDSFIVYRGQVLSSIDFDRMQKTQGGLMSFNCFLSTSLDRNVALSLAESNQDDSNLVGVLFQITIDTSISSCPFANVEDISYYSGAQEILFSMHSVFRIGEMKQINENNRLWQVNLTLTSDTDPQLQALTKVMRAETQGWTGWYQLGRLMIKLGQFSKSEVLHTTLLEQNTDENRKAHLYGMLGQTKFLQEEYEMALEFYEQALEIQQKTLPENHPNLTASYNNIASVYAKMGMSSEQSQHPTIRRTEHVQLVKYQRTIENITVESASACCNDFLYLTLTYGDGSSVNTDTSVQLQTFNRNINLIIACLDVTPPTMETIKYKNVQIASFDNEFACIAQLLSIEDKLIYFIVSTVLGGIVVPFIHNHGCIKYIYIHRDCNVEESIDWMKKYPKIRGNGFSIDFLIKQINEDIDSAIKCPSRWSRSKALLAELCSQTPQASIPAFINKATEDDFNTWRIVLLYFDSHRSFDLSSPKIRINKFDNTERCIQSIETEQISVFLIISMNQLSDIRSLAELEAVQALYIVSNLKSDEQIELLSMCSKLSGVFAPNEDLLEQLTADICFYRHIQVYTSTMSCFKIESNILDKLNDIQKDFLCFQLFSDVLSKLPIQSESNNNDDMEDGNQLLSRLIEVNLKILYRFNQFDIFTRPKSIIELNNINRHIASVETNNNTSSITVYRAELVSQKTIEMLKENSNAFLAIHAYVLASRSFQCVAEICRRAVNSQLTVVLFEIKLFNKALAASVDSDVIIFNLGTLFRLISVNPGPDGIWQIQLEIDNTTMRRIIDQLRIEIGTYFTWLTFGNYLAAFKRFNTAQHYFEYLQQILPPEHHSLGSIYNNMGLMYLEKKEDEAARELFKKALKMKIPELSVQEKQKSLSTLDLPPARCNSFNRISILHKLAEISCHLGNRKESLKYYREALQTATDATLRQFYEAKIGELLSSNESFET